MSQIMARVRVCSGLTRYRSLRTLLTSTGGSSNRVLDGAFQESLYSRSAGSNAMADAMFIEPSAHQTSSCQAPRISPWSTKHQQEQRSQPPPDDRSGSYAGQKRPP